MDAPEGACIWTVTHKEELIPAQEWAAMRPYMLSLDENGWGDVKQSWIKMCRLAGPDCNIHVQSVDALVRAIDDIAGKILEPGITK